MSAQVDDRTWLARWRHWAHLLKHEVYALYLAYRDPRVPWYARVVAGLVVAYAFSPIDLIPDFIPILGYLDDLLLLPLGIALAIRLLPPTVLAESRAAAAQRMADGKPINRAMAVCIVTLWLALAGLGIALLWRSVRQGR